MENTRFANSARHRSLIAGTGADLQDFFGALEVEGLRHQGHDVRLGYRLPFSDGQWMVVVGLTPQRFLDKQMSRNLAHRRKDSWVMDASRGELGIHHAISGFLEVYQGLELFARQGLFPGNSVSREPP